MPEANASGPEKKQRDCCELHIRHIIDRLALFLWTSLQNVEYDTRTRSVNI